MTTKREAAQCAAVLRERGRCLQPRYQQFADKYSLCPKPDSIVWSNARLLNNLRVYTMGDVPDGRDPIVVLSSPYAPHGTAFDARAFRCVEPECMHLEIKSWRNRTPDDLVMHKYGPERSPYQHGTVLIIVGRSGGAVEILRQRMDADPLQFEGPR